MHGREHLNVEGRKAVVARQAGGHQVSHGLCGELGIVGFEKEEVASRFASLAAYLGHFPVVDAVGIGDDEALRRLAEDLV